MIISECIANGNLYQTTVYEPRDNAIPVASFCTYVPCTFDEMRADIGTYDDVTINEFIFRDGQHYRFSSSVPIK